MASQSWKNLERKVAKDFDTRRVLEKGRSVPDVIAMGGKIIIDTKNRKRIRIKQAVKDIQQYRENKEQILCLIHKETGKKTMKVFMTSSDFIKLVKNSLQKRGIVVELDYKDFLMKAKSLK